MPHLPGRLSALPQLLAATFLVLGAACAPRPAAAPRLVVIVVVDQLRPDAIDSLLPGGIGRLLREGRVFADAVLGHAYTETCSGHVALVTGRHPGPAGVPGNFFVDPESGRTRICVEDAAEGARSHGGTNGRSPRQMRVTALGDWLKQAHPGARVFAVSAKDRAAIPLGGRDADAAYWLDRSEARGFTTSRYYRPELPEWVRRFNGSNGGGGFLAELPERWEHPSEDPSARADRFPGEAGRLGGVSPHPVADPDAPTALQQLYASPFVDSVTLAFARALVEHEGLGGGPAPDWLGVSLSATDTVGHLYGPGSQEARDALRRLDAELGRFLAFLERRVGGERLLVVLTSDHGVLELPEWLVATGRGECPLPGGRADATLLLRALETELAVALGEPPEGLGPWLRSAEYRLTVNRALARARGVAVEEVVTRARHFFAGVPGIARVWTAAEIEAGAGPEPFATLYRNSHTPGIGGDLVIQPARDCLISRFPEGTSHGSPYLYDRAIPLVFFGAGVEAGTVRGPAQAVDVAPTLARALGLAAPEGLDGVALPLAASP